MKLVKADKIDDIRNSSLFICSLCIFTGLMILGRLMGNYSVVTVTDWIFGIIGTGIIMIAFILPLTRLRNSINAHKEQKSTIVVRFVFISLFLNQLSRETHCYIAKCCRGKYCCIAHNNGNSGLRRISFIFCSFISTPWEREGRKTKSRWWGSLVYWNQSTLTLLISCIDNKWGF